jgi:hypothetical protein
MGTVMAIVESGMSDEAVGQGPMDPGGLCRATSSIANPGSAEPTVADILRALPPEAARDRPAPVRVDPQGNLQVRGLEVRRDTHEDPDEQVVEYLAERSPISIAVEGRTQVV